MMVLYCMQSTGWPFIKTYVSVEPTAPNVLSPVGKFQPTACTTPNSHPYAQCTHHHSGVCGVVWKRAYYNVLPSARDSCIVYVEQFLPQLKQWQCGVWGGLDRGFAPYLVQTSWDESHVNASWSGLVLEIVLLVVEDAFCWGSSPKAIFIYNVLVPATSFAGHTYRKPATRGQNHEKCIGLLCTSVKIVNVKLRIRSTRRNKVHGERSCQELGFGIYITLHIIIIGTLFRYTTTHIHLYMHSSAGTSTAFTYHVLSKICSTTWTKLGSTIFL